MMTAPKPFMTSTSSTPPTPDGLASEISTQDDPNSGDTKAKHSYVKHPWRLFLYSAIGMLVFFFPVTYKDKSSIPLDHMVTIVIDVLGEAVNWVMLAIMAYGVVRLATTKAWKKGLMSAVFAALNVLGLIVGLGYLLDLLPSFLVADDLIPFLWSKIVIPVGLIVPIGSLFLSLLVTFGLMEFVGVLMQPIMRPVWKTPGRSAIDAVASFVGSYSLGLLITDRVYKQGSYTAKEAAIIATGFSTVSAAFMVIVAKTVGIMHLWGTYFFVSLVVTFIVTAITVRIPPLRTMPDEYYKGVTPNPEAPVEGKRLPEAWHRARMTLDEAPSVGRAMGGNFLDGLRMSASITPSIMSVGLLGLLVAKFTPVFDWLGYLFYPFAWIVRLPEPLLAGKASATGIAEMLLPATQVADSEHLVLWFVIAIVAVSMVIFFSAVVPCIMATDIPVKISHLVVIWFQRVALTILIATPIAHLIL